MKTISLTIQQAAKLLNVSPMTLRRWEEKGILIPQRTEGNQRRYELEDIQNFKKKKPARISVPIISTHSEASPVSNQQYKMLSTETLSQVKHTENILEPTPEPDIEEDKMKHDEEVQNTPLLTDLVSPISPAKNEADVQVSPVRAAVSPVFKPSYKSTLKNHTDNLHKNYPLFLTGLLLVSLLGAIALTYSVYDAKSKQASRLASNAQTSNQDVLAAQTKGRNLGGEVLFNVPAIFTGKVTIKNDFVVNGKSLFTEDVTVANKNLTLGTGKLTASNVVYGLTAGANVTITGDPQNPTISAGITGGVESFQGQSGIITLTEGDGIGLDGLTITNTGVLSLGGETGDVELTAGDGIAIDGTTITNDDPGSAQNIFKTILVDTTALEAGSNDDTLTFTAGTGITITPDSSTNTITIDAAGASSQWTTSGSDISYTTGNVGIGTGSPGRTLDVTGTARVTGGVTFSAFGTGILHTDASGVLSSSALNLGGGATEIIGTLPVGNGGTGATTFTSNGVLYGNGSGALQTTSAANAGQMLIGNGSGIPTFTTLSGGATLSGTGALSLTLSQSGSTASTSANSGLEFSTSSGLSLLRGCTNGQVLKWDNTTSSWGCGNDAGASATSIVNVENSDVAIGSGVDTLDFGADFVVTASPISEANISVADDALDFSEFADSLTLDAATTIALTNFDFTLGTNGGTGKVVIAPNAGGDAAVIINKQNSAGDIFTASASGTTRLTLSNNGNLDLATGVYQIAGTTVLSGTALGTGIIGSSLTSVGALATGSIANGFGSIFTANTIQGSDITASGTTGFSATGNDADLTFSGIGNHVISASAGTLTLGPFTLNGTVTGNGQDITGVDALSASGTITFASFTSNGGILYTNASGQLVQVAAGATNQILHGGTTPSFGSVQLGAGGDVTGTLLAGNGGTGFSTYTQGDLLYGNGSNTLSRLGLGGDGSVLTVSGGNPAWISSSSINFWQRSNGVLSPLNISDDLLLGATATNSARFAFTGVAGGTPTASISGSTANNALYLTGDGTIGTTNRQSLTFGSASTGNIVFNGFGAGVLQTNGSGVVSAGTITVSNGGTGTTTFTGNGILYGNGTGAIQVTAAGTDGQVLMGQTSGVPVYRTIGGDATINSADGTLTIAAGAVALTTDTSGDYVATITSGNGISASATGEGSTPTINLAALTSNWDQTGAFDISLNNAGSELRMLESAGGAFFGTLDVGDLAADKTYVLPNFTGASANICLDTGNCAGSGGGITGAGTAGQLAYFTGAGAIASENSGFAWDATNDRLGIGNDTPFGKLDINGASTGKALVILNETGNQNILVGSSSGTTRFAFDGSGNLNLASGAYQIAGASVLNSTTLGTSVINSSLQTVGTIGTGTWQATAIGAQYGGTGDNTSATTGVPYIAAGNWQYEAQLSSARGGTGADLSAAAQGAVPYFSGTGVMSALPAGNAGYVLTTNGTNQNPSWTDAASLGTNYWDRANGALSPKFASVNDLLLGSNATSSAKFAFINVNSGTPTASIAGTAANTAVYLTGDGTLATTNKQSLVIGSASTGNIVLNGFGAGVLQTNASGVISTGTISVGSGGTGATTLASNGVLFGNGTGAIQATTAGTDGQILVGQSGSAPIFRTLGGDAAINSATGDLTIAGNAVQLGTDTTGDFVARIATGSGILVSGTLGEDSVQTVSLGALTSNWDQTGAFDVVLNNAGSELQILESSGGTYYATLDAGDLTGNKTYVLPEFVGASADICLSTGNCSGGAGASKWQLNGNVIAPLTLTNQVAIGGGTTTDFFLGVSGAREGKALAGLNETGDQHILTASASGTNVFNLTRSGTIEMLESTGGTFFGTIGVGDLAANKSYVLPNFTGSSADICLSTGNCAGSGGGLTGSGTAGQIAFFNGAGSLTSETSGFAWDATNKRLGIGTDSPVSKFDTQGFVTGKALVSFNETGGNDIFTASASGTTRLTLSNTGNLNLTGGVYQSGGSSGITQGTPSCVTTTGGIVTGFGVCQLGSEQWVVNSGSIYTGVQTLDLLLGGTSTASARFAVLNMAGGTPSATISAGTTNNAAFLTGAGNLGTTNAQTLTIGGPSTGNIVVDSGSDLISLMDTVSVNGNAGITAAGAITGTQLDIDGTLRLNGTTLSSIGGNDLTLDAADGNILFADGDTLNAGGKTAQAYNFFANNADAPEQVGIDADNDLYIGGSLEVDGIIYQGDNQVCDSSGNCAGTTNYWQLNSGSIAPGNAANAADRVIVGGSSTTTAFQFEVNGKQSGKALVSLNETGNQDIFTASSAGTTRFRIANNGDLVATGGLSGLSSLTSGGTVTFTGVTANRALFTDGSSNVTGSGASSALVSALTDETGSGVAVFDTSPTFTTSILGAGTGSFDLINSGVTTLNVGGGATAINMGAAGALVTLGSGGNATITTSTNGNLILSAAGSGNTTLSSDFNSSIFVGNASTPAPLSISGGIGSNASFVVNQTNSGDLIAASASGVTRFLVDNSGNITVGTWQGTAIAPQFGGTGDNTSGTTGVPYIAAGNWQYEASLDETRGGTGLATYVQGDLLYASAADTLARRAIGSAGQVLTVSAGLPTWVDPSTLANSYWQRNGNAVSPTNITDDVLFGGTSTASAKFAFINNIGAGTPTASISAGSNNTAFLTGAGNLGTTNAQTLTLGGISTGNIVLDAGSGLVSVADALRITGNVDANNGLDVTGADLTVGGTNATITTAGVITGTTINATTAIQTGSTTRIDSSGNLSQIGTIDSTFLDATSNNVNLAASTNLQLNGTTVITSGRNLESIAGVTTDLTPTANNTYDLGSNSNRFAEIHGQTLYQAGNQVCDTGGNCSGLSVTYWDQANGAVYTKNSTVDLLVGGTSTASAKFAIINVAGNAPVASLSGATGGSYLSAAGTLQTTNNQTLNIGGNSTGNIVIDSNTGNITLADNTTFSQNMTVAGSTGLTFSSTGGIVLNGGTVLDNTDEVDINDDLAVSGLIQVGNATATTYSRFGTDTAGGGNINAANDLLISGALEVNDLLYADGGIDTTFTQGSILFAGASGVLAENNSNFFWDNTNARLGLGTTSPLARLDIRGQNATTPAASISALSNFAGLVVDNNGTGDLFTASKSGATKFTILNSGNLQLGNYTTTNGVLYTNASGVVQQSGSGGEGSILTLSGGTPTWVSSSSINYWQRANNAISPLNITDDLLLGGSSTASARFAFINNVGPGTPTASISAGTANNAAYLDGSGVLGTTNKQSLTLGSLSTGNVYVSPGGSTVLTAMTGGNVGIGTTNPNQRLEIQGGNLLLNNGGSGILMRPDNGGSAFVLGSGSNATLGDFYFQTTAGGNNSVVLGATGALGLGTISPTAMLDVRGTSGTNPIASFSGQTARAALIVDNSGNGDLFTASSSGATRFRIANNGQIAISSLANCNTIDTDANGVLSCGVDAGSGFADYWQLNGKALSPNNSTYDFLLGGTSTSSARFAFTNNTGPGTPTASISANTTDNATYLTGAGVLGTTNKQTLNLGSASTGNVSLAPGGTTALTALANGYVGIGTTAPTSALHVMYGSANSTSTNPVLTLDNPAGGTQTSLLFNTAGTNRGLITADSGGSLYLSSGNNATTYLGYNSLGANIGAINFRNGSMLLDTNGNLGLGTISPLATLDIRGTSGTTPIASFSGSTAKASLIVDNSGVGDLFSASTSGISRFTVTKTGALRLNGNGTDTFLSPQGTPIQTKINIPVFDPGDFGQVLAFGVPVGANSTARALAVLDNRNGPHQPSIATFSPNEATSVGFSWEGSDTASYIKLSGNADTLGVRFNNSYDNGTQLNPVIFSIAGNAPIASFSGSTGKAGIIVDNNAPHGDLFAASKSGATKFVINSSGNLQFAGATNFLSTIQSAATAARTWTLPNESGTLCVQASTNCGFATGTNFWQTASTGTISPYNNTVDLLIGGTSTASAKFAVLNVAGNTTTASVSGTTGGAYMTSTGEIQATNLQNLVLGGSTTGEVSVLDNLDMNNFSIQSLNALDISDPGAGEGINFAATAASWLIDVSPLNRSNGDGNLNLYGTANNIALWRPSMWVYDATNYTTATAQSNGGLDFTTTGTGNITFNPGGSVGIGATTPLARLDVRGLSGTTPIASLSGQTAVAGLMVDNRGSGDIFTASSSGLNRFVIKQNGNVGIGVTNPSSELDVRGQITARGPSAGLHLEAQDNSTNFYTLYSSAGELSFYGGLNIRAVLTAAGNFGLGLNNSFPQATLDVKGTSGITPVATFSGQTAQAGLIVDNNGVGDLFTASKSGATKFVIKNNGDLRATNYNTAGGVFYGSADGTLRITAQGANGECLQSTGVGGAPTWGSCDQSSSVNAFTTTGGLIHNGNLTTDFAFGGNSTASAKFGISVSGTRPTASVSANTSAAALLVDNTGPGDLIVASKSGQTLFRVYNDGSVNIGKGVQMPNPQGVLTLMRPSQSARENSLYFQNPNLDSKIYMPIGSDDMRFYLQSFAGDLLSLTQTGRVGIGAAATSPMATLDIRGTTPTLAIASVSGQTTHAALIVDNRGSGDLFTASSSGLNRFVIKQNGNVGFGTTTPNMAGYTGTVLTIASPDSPVLEFNRASTASNTLIGTFRAGNTSGSALSGIDFYSGSTNTRGVIDFLTRNASGLNTSMRIDENGNVGVGTTSPLATFDVRGNTGTTPVASFSGQTTNASLIVDNRGTGDLFTASSSGYSRFVISNNGNVGIGTSNPQDLLHITMSGTSLTNGLPAISLQNTHATNKASAILFKDKNNSPIWQITNDWSEDGSQDFAIHDSAANALRYYVDTSGRTVLGLRNNTAVPGLATLDVRGNVNTQPAASFSATSTFAAQIINQSDIGDLFTASKSGATKFVIKNNGDLRATNYNTAGGVFYGSSDGTLRITGTAGNSGECLQSSGGGAPTWGSCDQASSVNAFTMTGGLIHNGNLTADFAFGGNSTASAKFSLSVSGTRPTASVSANTSSAGLVVDNRGSGDLFAASSSGLNRFVIAQNGNVGIGTNIPDAPLNLIGYAHVVNGSGSPAGFIFENTIGSAFSAYAGSSNPSLQYDSNFDFAIKSNTRVNVLANTGSGGTDRLLITGTGRVGINNSVPLQTLDVMGINGTIAIASFSGQTAAVGVTVDNNGFGDIFTASKSGATKFVIKNNGDLRATNYNTAGGVFYGSTDGTLRITAQGTSGECLQSTGVGGAPTWGSCDQASSVNAFTTANGLIYNGNLTTDFAFGGTSTASAKFSISVSGTRPTASVSANSSYVALLVDNRGSGDLFTASSSGFNRFVIKQNGNIGIDNGSPTQKLQVDSGNILVRGTGNFGTLGDRASVYLGDTSNSISAIANTGLTLSAFFANDALTVQNLTGNIGLGTTTPVAKLDIRGNSGTAPLASMSGSTTGVGLIVDNNGTGDIFTASKSGKTFFTVKNSGVVQIGSTANGLTFDYLSGGPNYTGSGRPTKQLVLSPEYAGGILTASGSATTDGDITAEASSSAGTALITLNGTAQNYLTYYEWNSAETTAQDYTIGVRVTLPADFSSWIPGGSSIQVLYNTELTTNDSSKVDMYLYPSNSSTPTVYRQAQTSATAKQWTSINVASTDLNDGTAWNQASQSAMLFFKLSSKNNNHVQLGDIILNYLSKF